MKKVGELATHHFVGSDNKLCVEGIIIAGSSNFKADLEKNEILDQRVQEGVISLVDVSYGGENGLNEAIQLSAGTLSNVKFMHEKTLLSDFYVNLKNEEMVVFGPTDTIFSLECGAVDKLIIYEDLEYMRVEVKHPISGDTKILYLKPDQLDNPKHFIHDGTELEVLDRETPLIEWLIDHYKDYGSALELVSNKSQEGFQFVEGFGGIGGFLRYKVDLDAEEMTKLDAGDDDFDPDEDFI